jgi:hypothetical protein
MSKFRTLRIVNPSSLERILTMTEDRLVLDAINNDND